MSSIAVAPADSVLSLLLSSFAQLSLTKTESPDPQSHLTLPDSSTVTGTNTIASYLSTQIPLFAQAEYSELEQAEIQQWLTLTSPSPPADATLDTLNEHLKFRSTLLGEKLSIADVVAYARLAPVVAGWSDEQRTGEKGRPHVVRWVDYIQNTPELALAVDNKVEIDPAKVLFVPKPEEVKREKKEKKEEGEAAPKKLKGRAGAAEKAKMAVEGAGKKVEDAKEEVKEAAGKAAAAVKGQKTEKKQKPKREPPPPKEEPVISPAQIDLRVGHILYCRPHPNADSLFVSTIAMGDPADSPVVTPASEITDLPESVTARFNPLPPVRTVCSGLNGLVPLAEMQDRKVVVVANLKPVTMRGIKSAAMVLAASPPPAPGAEDTHKKEVVELVAPPEGAEAGQKVFFEGYEGTPEAQLNPKKKVFEQIQPGFQTDAEDGTVTFVRAKAGWTGDAEKGKAKGGEVAKLVTASGGVCKAPSLRGANVS